MHMGRVSGTRIYNSIGIDRAVYERMGAWTTFSDRPDYGRAVLCYEREACAVLASICDAETMARRGVGPRRCGCRWAAPSAQSAASGAPSAKRRARRLYILPMCLGVGADALMAAVW